MERMTQMSSMHLPTSGENLAHRDAAFALLNELERRWKSGAGATLRLHVERDGLAGVFGEHRLRVERIYLRRAAIHEEVNHALCFGGKLGRMRQQGRSSGRGRAELLKRAPRASEPKPMPECFRSCRRLNPSPNRDWMEVAVRLDIPLIHKGEFTGLQQHLR